MRINRVIKDKTAVGRLMEAILSIMKATLAGVVVGLTIRSRPARPTIGISCSLEVKVSIGRIVKE